jgi:uncharacterized protein
MVVSMIQFIIEIPDAMSLKDKRRVVKSLKERIGRRFNVSVAEVDLHDSMCFSQIGAAHVSNSGKLGEKIMQRILSFVEDEIPGRLHDVVVHVERY